MNLVQRYWWWLATAALVVILLFLWPGLSASMVALLHVSWLAALIMSGIVVVGTFVSLLRLLIRRDD